MSPQSSVVIPIANGQEIDVPLDSLPDDCEEIIDVLETEQISLSFYLRFAKIYHLRGNQPAYFKFLEGAHRAHRKESDQRSYAEAMSLLVSRHLSQSQLDEAVAKINDMDRVDSRSEFTLLARGSLLLAKNELDPAASHFSLVLERNGRNFIALLASSNIQFLKRNYKEALAGYRKILRYYPQCPWFIRLGIAQCQLKLGKWEDARCAFQRTLQLKGDCPEALAGLSLVLSKLEPEAVHPSILLLQSALQMAPKDASLLLPMAVHYLYKKDFPRCFALAFQALAVAESDCLKALAALLIGRCFLVRRNYDEALRYLMQAKKLQPESPAISFSLGQCYVYREDFELAIDAFELVIRSNPNHYESLKAFCALCHLEEKFKKRMSSHISRLVSEYPSDIEAKIIFASYCEEIDPPRAIFLYDDLIMALKEGGFSAPPAVISNRAVLLFSCGEQGRAVSDIRSIQPAHLSSATDFVLVYNFGKILQLTGDLSEAKSIYERLLQQNPQYIDAYYSLATIAQDHGDFAEAIRLLTQAQEIDPGSKFGWWLLSKAYRSKKEYSASRKAMETVLSTIDAHDVTAHIVLGTYCYENYQRSDDRAQREAEAKKALAFFHKALSLDSNNFYAANGIGMCFMERGMKAQASDLFLKLKQSETGFADAWVNLAHIYLQSGQVLAALNLYENCNKKFYSNQDAILLMFTSKCYYMLGRAEKNFSHLDRAIECLQAALEHTAGDDLMQYNLAMCQQEFSAVRLALEDSRRTTQDVEQAIRELDNAIRIFSTLAAHGSNGKKHTIYEADRVRGRLSECKSLRQNAAALLTKQQEEDQRKRERMERLRELRVKEQQSQEQEQAFTQEQRKQQEKELEKQRAATQCRAKPPAQEAQAPSGEFVQPASSTVIMDAVEEKSAVSEPDDQLDALFND